MKAELTQQSATVKVVIDSNVWISALLNQHGAPAQFVKQALGKGLPVFSNDTFAELESRLWRPKFDRYLSMEQRQRLLHDIDAIAHWVELPPAITALSYCRDGDDDKFIHTALAAEAKWLVTGDQDLLVLQGNPLLSDLTILSPDQALSDPEWARV
ncbi:MAG: putative toxin-antitoxin system toxin component, PIN family [Methyloglobulus sp.]|nr:putative toxin-antitoxin system toxin component, PIN family [Methyloglobulus sp.]